MHIKKYILLLASVLFVVACSNDDFTHQEPIQDGPVKVGFWMGRGDSENTRTFINDDGQTISWEAEDKVALWAQKDNVYTFQNQTFDTWFVAAETNQAFFTTTLPEAMPEGTYTYYACYPKPQSVNGTTATFTLPSMQDGKMGGGADIMVAQGTGPALEKLYTPADPNDSEVVPDYIIEDGLTLNMHHLIHALRFYVPAGKWGFPTGETVERIVFTMPANVAGTVTADVSNTNGLTLTSGGTNTISLNLKEPIGPSAADGNGIENYDYACASIIPNTYSGDMTIKVYSQTKASQVTIPINGREMKAGHITPVGLNCTDVVNRPKISFRIASNNLGEKPYKITLTSSDTSTQWKAGDDHVYEYYTGSESSTIAVGGGFDIYTDEEVLSSISGKSVTVTYESKSAIMTQTINMPTIAVSGDNNISLDIPYLLFEDFNRASATTSYTDDENGMELNGVGLNGWTASRWAIQSGTLRLSTYIGTTAAGGTDINFSRTDSPQLSGIKDGKNINVSISFDLGLTRIKETVNLIIYKYTNDIQASGIFGTSPYDSSNPAPNGGKITVAGQLSDKNLPVNQVKTITDCTMGTSLDVNKMKHYTYTVKCDNTTRLTWFNDYLLHEGAPAAVKVYGYIDNIKVQIVSE